MKTKNWPIIELTGIWLFIASVVAGDKDVLDEVAPPSYDDASAIVVEGKALHAEGLNISIEDQVYAYFKDEPILAKIAWCESKFVHYTQGGTVLRGVLTPADVGVMQINEYYHGKTAEVLNLNIHTPEGNMAYARWLYEREGTRPWNPSRKCWDDVAMK